MSISVYLYASSVLIMLEVHYHCYIFHCRGEVYDRNLVHSIESVIIEWSHQIQDVLKKDSAQPLLEGLNPGPLVEIEFWKSKAQNLECIYDQVHFIHQL